MKQDQIIGGKYRVIKVLGQGGTSVVYLAENTVLNNLWAIKALSKSNEWFSSEMKELTILKGLSHPMLPRIVDFLEEPDFCYIVMDYIPGVNLLDYLRMNVKVTQEQLLQWTKDLLGVLEYLHGRSPAVVYRDLKPANLILDESEHLRLVDFGTASLNREEATEDTVYIGTQGYAAPEQYGLGRSDARTDLYNLGMTLVHLATGIHPLKIGTASVEKTLRQSGISLKFVHYILELIASDPDRRPHDCMEAFQKLEKVTSGGPAFLRARPKTVGNKSKTIIGISSILPNSGLTSLCLMLGSYLKKQGQHVALAELNPSCDFWNLCDVLEQADSLKSRSESSFEALGMTFFPKAGELYQIPRKPHDVLILDLGCIKNGQALQELGRSDIKLILCPGAPWKFPRIFEALDEIKPEAVREVTFAVCSPQKTEEQTLRSLYKLNPVVTFPLPVNPFALSKEDEKRIGNALKEAGGRFSDFHIFRA